MLLNKETKPNLVRKVDAYISLKHWDTNRLSNPDAKIKPSVNKKKKKEKRKQVKETEI